MSGYEDALNMFADVLENKDHFTPDRAAVTAASPLGHNKVMDFLKENSAMPMWNNPSHTEKIHKYMVTFGANLLLKDNTRCYNMAAVVARTVMELELRGGAINNNISRIVSPLESDADGHCNVDMDVARFFRERISCSCLDSIKCPVQPDKEDVWSQTAKYLMKTEASPNCANCGSDGKSGTLKTCNSCKIVKYCSRDCQIIHWKKEHKFDCPLMTKELHEEALFKDPPKREDCDICCLPLPLNRCRVNYQSCCGKTLCYGCVHYSGVAAKAVTGMCPFCRAEGTYTHAEAVRRLEKRIELNDAGSYYTLGCKYRDGIIGLPQDHNKAFKLFLRGVELGSLDAHYHVGFSYYNGHGCEVDVKKALHYFEVAAMKGDENSRYNLAVLESNTKRATKHYMIAARAGHNEAMAKVRQEHLGSRITKEDYEYTSKIYEETVDLMKSVQRDSAAKKYKLSGGVLDM